MKNAFEDITMKKVTFLFRYLSLSQEGNFHACESTRVTNGIKIEKLFVRTRKKLKVQIYFSQLAVMNIN